MHLSDFLVMHVRQVLRIRMIDLSKASKVVVLGALEARCCGVPAGGSDRGVLRS
jgi:hypothetical protein